jgi:hypothetical protein
MEPTVPLWIRSDQPATLDVRVIGRIAECTHPESAEMLPDGEHFLFGNCAMKMGVAAYRSGGGPVYLDGQAYVSLGRIDPAGGVVQVEEKMVAGLTGTLGCDVLTVATERFRAGTVFMARGGAPLLAQDEVTLLEDAAVLRSQVLVFDAQARSLVGCLPLWEGTAFARRFNAVNQPNGLAINARGDLFVGDIPHGNSVSVLPPPVPSAVYHIPHASIDGLAADDPEAVSQIRRVLTPGFVNGLTVSPVDGECWMVSCSSHDEAGGAVYRLTDAEFDSGQLPEPAVTGLGVLDGVTFTRRGALLVTNPRTGEIHLFGTDGSHRLLRVAGQKPWRSPADINICYPKALAGEPALLVPDVAVMSGPGESSVFVLDLSDL